MPAMIIDTRELAKLATDLSGAAKTVQKAAVTAVQTATAQTKAYMITLIPVRSDPRTPRGRKRPRTEPAGYLRASAFGTTKQLKSGAVVTGLVGTNAWYGHFVTNPTRAAAGHHATHAQPYDQQALAYLAEISASLAEGVIDAAEGAIT